MSDYQLSNQLNFQTISISYQKKSIFTIDKPYHFRSFFKSKCRINEITLFFSLYTYKRSLHNYGSPLTFFDHSLHKTQSHSHSQPAAAIRNHCLPLIGGLSSLFLNLYEPCKMSHKRISFQLYNFSHPHQNKL